MGLLDGFEKLINEHGSAAILKERIVLANDKYAALERKLSDCESAKVKLDSENKALRLNLEKAEVEIQNFKKAADLVHTGRLEEIREKILVAVAGQDEIDEQAVSQITGASQLVCTFHLEELKKSRMVSASHYAGSDWSGTSGRTTWSVAQAGRAYLVGHGLVA